MGGGGEITVFRDITFSYRKVPEQPMVQEPHGKKKKKVLLIPQNLVYVKPSAEGPAEITGHRAKGCKPYLLWFPGGKASNLRNQQNSWS